jgi:Tfp pilus assembly protein PilO
VKQLEGDKRLVANQLEQVNRKLEIMEESYVTLLKKNPTENEIIIN